MPVRLSRLSAVALLSLCVTGPPLRAEGPAQAGRAPAVAPVADTDAKRPSPAATAQAYLEALDVHFKTTAAGTVTEAVVHCVSEMTDTDMALFRHFPGLEKLTVVGPEVTDAGLAHLRNLPELKDLSLYREHFTEDGMAQLKVVPKLRKLVLSRAQLTERGLEQLAGVTGLESLELPAYRVTPAALGQLKKLPSLTSLKLRGSDFSDSDAKTFAGFPRLTTLKVGGKMTAAGLEAVRAVLPGVTVGH